MNATEFMSRNNDTHEELIHGEIIPRPPRVADESFIQKSLMLFFYTNFGLARASASAAMYAADHSVLDPYALLLKPFDQKTSAFRADGAYDPRYVQIAVEVFQHVTAKDLSNDGSFRLSAYAEAEIPCIWVIDLKTRTIDEFKEPAKTEDQKYVYRQTVKYTKDDQLNVAGNSLDVRDIFR